MGEWLDEKAQKLAAQKQIAAAALLDTGMDPERVAVVVDSIHAQITMAKRPKHVKEEPENAEETSR